MVKVNSPATFLCELMGSMPGFDPRVWADIFDRIGLYHTLALMVALTCCVAVGVRGPAWLKVILDHRRQMFQITLKEKEKKEALNRKLEQALAKQAANPTQKRKPKGSP